MGTPWSFGLGWPSLSRSQGKGGKTRKRGVARPWSGGKMKQIKSYNDDSWPRASAHLSLLPPSITILFLANPERGPRRFIGPSRRALWPSGFSVLSVIVLNIDPSFGESLLKSNGKNVGKCSGRPPNSGFSGNSSHSELLALPGPRAKMGPPASFTEKRCLILERWKSIHKDVP